MSQSHSRNERQIREPHHPGRPHWPVHRRSHRADRRPDDVGDRMIDWSPADGVLTIARDDLPAIEQANGRPKAPAQTHHEPVTNPAERIDRLRREALEKIALAKAWENLLEKQERDIAVLTYALQYHLGPVPATSAALARVLVEEEGWKR